MAGNSSIIAIMSAIGAIGLFATYSLLMVI